MAKEYRKNNKRMVDNALQISTMKTITKSATRTPLKHEDEIMSNTNPTKTPG
jgi:ribosomal protein S20